MASEELVDVTLKRTTIKSVGIKKGKATIVIEAPVDDESSNMTVGDVAEMTGGTFLGTVKIKGRALQVLLIPPITDDKD